MLNERVKRVLAQATRFQLRRLQTGETAAQELRRRPLAAPVPNHPFIGVVGFSNLPKSGFFKDTRGWIGVSERVRIDRTNDCFLERTLNHLGYRIRGQPLPRNAGAIAYPISTTASDEGGPLNPPKPTSTRT